MSGPSSCSTAIALIIFNRPAYTQTVLQAISAVRPSLLFVLGDGPRAHSSADVEACEQVRKLIDAIDWPCEVLKNYSSVNTGPRERVISGLNWVFSLVDEAIILDDDCVPNPSFFAFCEELLARFRGDSRVGMISGTNFVEGSTTIDYNYSYYFSRISHIWGWATWRTSWQKFDPQLRLWPEVQAANLLSEVLEPPGAVRYWSRIFDKAYRREGPDSWDYPWFFSNLISNSLSIVPRVNLVTNIGFGPDATNTVDADFAQRLESAEMEFPLKHPPVMFPLRSMERLDQEIAFLEPMRQWLCKMTREIEIIDQASEA